MRLFETGNIVISQSLRVLMHI